MRCVLPRDGSCVRSVLPRDGGCVRSVLPRDGGCVRSVLPCDGGCVRSVLPCDGAVCVVFTVFYDEVTGTLERALSEGISTDNMVLEINSVK